MSSMSREKADEICKHIKENSGAIFGQKFWECRLACALLAQQKGDRWESRFLAIAKFRVFILNGKGVNSLKIEKCFNIVALRYLELLQQDRQLQIGWEERSAKPSAVVAPPMLHILVRLPAAAAADNHNNGNDNTNDFETEQEQLQHNHHHQQQQQQQRCRTVRELAMDLLATLKHYFPDIQRSLAKHFLTISPSLIADFPALPSSTPELPCHNFRRSYVAHCDWLEQPFRDEVIWDIERIYFVHAQHELDLNDFNHLPAKDLQALIGAVQFSDFFTAIRATGQRLQVEHVDALLALVRRSHSLRSLRLCRCTVPKDFVALLAAALAMNPTVPLERLRLDELSIDEKKGLAQLGTMLPQLPALHTLFLTDCALNEKLALGLLHALHHGIELSSAADSARAEAAERRGGTGGAADGCGGATAAADHHHHQQQQHSPIIFNKSSHKQRQQQSAMRSSLRSSSSSSRAVPPLLPPPPFAASAAADRFQLRALNLSGNQLGNGTELAEQLANLVALSDGAMRLLDLGGTAVQLDRLWSALKLGGLGLEVLRLGGCYCSASSSSGSKRSGGAKDSAQVTRELFAAVHSLKELNLSDTHVGPELLQGILDGLSVNPHLGAGTLHLCLDSSIVGSAACVSVLEQYIGDCACIGSLSVRDNALEHEAFRLLSALGGAAQLRALDIGGANFVALKSAKKHAPILAGILSELVKLVNGIERGEEAEEGASFIDELSLADARLGPHLSVFLNALGLCGRLKRLDLSNNELGPAGARLLCKSLQLNHMLRWLALDRNQIGPDGFAELARALRVNTALDSLHVPYSDAAECVVAMARMPAEQRARFQLQMEEIERCLERNRQLRTFATPSESPVAMPHLVQRIMHKLNSNCELYGLDECGRDAQLKKIAFHKLGKLIISSVVGGTNKNAGGGIDQQQQQSISDQQQSIGDDDRHDDDQNADTSTVLQTVADQLVERIEPLSEMASEHFVRQFLNRLADQEGVRVQPQHRQTEIDQQKCAAIKGLSGALRDDLVALLGKYQKEFAWSHLYATVHQCLLAEDGQEMFHVQHQQQQRPLPIFPSSSTASSSSCSTRTRNKEVMFWSSNINNTKHGFAGTAHHHCHRPESAIVPTDDVTAAVLMSRSVLGDFAHANGDNDFGTTTAAGQRKDGHDMNNHLLLNNLAKQRPKPARLNRSRVQPTMTTTTSTTTVMNEFSSSSTILSSSPSPLIANSHIGSTSPPPPSSATSPTHCANPKSSPSTCHNTDEAASPTHSPQLPFCVRPTPSSPPAVPPRREKMGGSGGGAGRSSSPMTPPKLPPKPAAHAAAATTTEEEERKRGEAEAITEPSAAAEQ